MSVNLWARENNREAFNVVLDKIFAIVPKESVKFDETISKIVEIPIGSGCELCKKELSDQTPQYYSPFTKHYYCPECAEFDDKTQKGLKRYKVTDTVIYIPCPLRDPSQLLNIDDYKIGKNQKISEDEEGSQ